MMSRQVPDFNTAYWRGRQHSFCVVIPVLNEGKRISDLLDRMAALDIAARADIIIVDGGSDDGSLDAHALEARNIRGLLIKTGAGGLSAQLRVAYAFALDQGYEGIITIDGNNKDDPEAIPRFIHALQGGVDFVQGSRFIAGGQGINTPRWREYAVRWLHAPLLSLFSLFRWTDTTQGFRAYSARLLRDQRVAPFRCVFGAYELLAYLSYRTPRLGFRCLELPTIRTYPATGSMPTKISNIRGNADLLKTLFYACLGFYNPNSRRRRHAFWFIVMSIILFASFYKDAFDVGRHVPSGPDDRGKQSFGKHDPKSESLILLRLIETDMYGFLYNGGLPSARKGKQHSSVYKDYLSDIRPPKFYSSYIRQKVRHSNVSFQAWFYGAMDQGLKLIGVDAKERLKYMHRATALALALALAALVLLIAVEFGTVAAALAFAFTLTSPWLTIFARNLYWMPFLWFLPMLWCWRYYVSRPPPQGRDWIIFSLGFAALVFLSSLRAYEYMTNILIAAGAVVVYGCTKKGFGEGFDRLRLFKHGGLLIVSGVMGFVMTLTVHLFLLGMYYSSFSQAGQLILGRAWIRSFQSGEGHHFPSYSLIFDAYWNYGTVVNIFNLIKLNAANIFTPLILMIVAGFFIGGQGWRFRDWHKTAPLTLFAFICLLASVSWYIVMKNHNAHYSLNYVLWHVPAGILLPALAWVLSADLIKRIVSKISS